METVDNSLIDRTEDNVDPVDINIRSVTPEYPELEVPGADPEKTDPTESTPDAIKYMPDTKEGD